MERRHNDALVRILEADDMWTRQGKPPVEFELMPTGGMGTEIVHPCWDGSWATPDKLTLDDLSDLGVLKVSRISDNGRRFTFTMQGRDHARALTAGQTGTTGPVSHAPNSRDVLDWLFAMTESDPLVLDRGNTIFERAIADGLIGESGRSAFAARLSGLISDGLLRGSIVRIGLASNERWLTVSKHFELTARAYELKGGKREPVAAQNFHGPIINGQFAAGDISNYVTFGEVLDKAEAELLQLDDVDGADRSDALELVSRLRGVAAAGSGQIVTAGGGGLLAAVLARILGLG